MSHENLDLTALLSVSLALSGNPLSDRLGLVGLLQDGNTLRPSIRGEKNEAHSLCSRPPLTSRAMARPDAEHRTFKGATAPMDHLKPRLIPINRRRRIYEGKAKVLYEGPEPGTLHPALQGRRHRI